MKSKVISGIIALGYLVVAYFTNGPELTWRVAIFLILPLACIWFSDAMGAYTGVGFGRGAITGKTPGRFVAFGGWLLLFLPAVVVIIVAFTGGK